MEMPMAGPISIGAAVVPLSDSLPLGSVELSVELALLLPPSLPLSLSLPADSLAASLSLPLLVPESSPHPTHSRVRVDRIDTVSRRVDVMDKPT
jgi:hypothetical protein